MTLGWKHGLDTVVPGPQSPSRHTLRNSVATATLYELRVLYTLNHAAAARRVRLLRGRHVEQHVEIGRG